jgi:hypothetical protein
MNKKLVPFNINDYVRVKLTDYGRYIHMRQFYENYSGVHTLGEKQSIKYSPPKEDREGYSRWQLWNLMSTFGEYMGLGFENLFETSIEFEIENK